MRGHPTDLTVNAPVVVLDATASGAHALDTSYSVSFPGAIGERCALAQYGFTFTGWWLVVSISSIMQAVIPSAATVVVTIDGVDHVLTATLFETPQSTRFDLASGGLHTVLITEGPQSNGGTPTTTPPVYGSSVASITLPKSANPVWTSTAPPSRRCVNIGNSISNGFDASVPQRTGYVALMRGSYAGRITVVGWGNAALHDWHGNTAALAGIIAAACNGAARNDIIFSLGSNDAAGGYSATFGADQLAVLQDPQLAGIVGKQVYLFTPIPRNGVDMSVILAASIANAAILGATLINGATIGLIEWTDYNADEIHPNDSGHAKIATALLVALA